MPVTHVTSRSISRLIDIPGTTARINIAMTLARAQAPRTTVEVRVDELLAPQNHLAFLTLIFLLHGGLFVASRPCPPDIRALVHHEAFGYRLLTYRPALATRHART